MKDSILLLMILIMAAIQIGVWSMFPKRIKDFVFANPFLAFGANLLGSMFIVGFTGIASMVGTANLGASVIFVCYAFYYKQRVGILGLQLKWIKILWVVPVIPYLAVKYKGAINGPVS